jgi:DNA-binding MarR family transcriptional regulator
MPAAIHAKNKKSPPGVKDDTLLMSIILVRLGRLNEIFISSIHEKVFGDMKVGYGEPMVVAAMVLEGPPYRSSPTELCRRSLLTSGGMTKTLGRLEKANLIKRIYDPNDRRALLVELTPEGEAIGREVLAQQTAHYADLLGGDGTKGYRHLRSILTKLEQTLGKPDTRGYL